MSAKHASRPAKRARPTVGSALKKQPGPDYQKGIEYWDGVEASVNGVLGGFGNGPVPHIEQLSSRLLLLSLVPSLHTLPSPLTPSPSPRPKHRLTVLDVGAGIGRVTANVLLPLFEDVVLVEPVDKFIRQGYTNATNGLWPHLSSGPVSLGDDDMSGASTDRGKRVWFLRGGLQDLDPARPQAKAVELGVVGKSAGGEPAEGFGKPDGEVMYDVIWCQWCLGHLTSPELVAFLKRARAALRPEMEDGTHQTHYGHSNLIFVKENVCEDGPDGKPVEFLDEEDSSLTRSNGKWLECFADAGLTIVKEEVQEGMPAELFMVKTWALI